MHILLIHQAFASVNEAGGTRHHELARYLANAGHKVSIIASPVSYLTGQKDDLKKVQTELDGKITIYRSYTYRALHKSFFHRIISFLSFMISSFVRSLRIKNVDIVWGTTPPIFQCISAWAVAKIKGTPFMLEVRDLWPDFAIAIGVLKNPILIRLSFWLEKFLYSHADFTIANSPGFLQHVKDRGAKHVSLVPNGADSSIISVHTSKDFRKKLNWDGKFVVLYAGAHGISNDLGVVLEAAHLLRGEHKILFVLLGDGKEKQNLMAEADTMKLQNLVFLPPVSKTEMGDYLFAADACLAILKPLELYKTTFPNKVFDYMAAKKPVILAIDGVIRDVVEAAKCGVFCQPGNPHALAEVCLALCHNKDQVKTMGENGYSYLQIHFNREKIAAQLNQLLINTGKIG